MLSMARNDKPKVYDRQSRDLPINSMVAQAVVDDPLERGAKLKVLRSVRDDPLAAMHSRGQIDDAMLAAGREWQRHHENTEIGNIAAIDPRREAVDGGRFPEPMSERYDRAFKELGDANRALGPFGSVLVARILADRESIAEVAVRFNYTSARETNYLSRRFRECLDTLAKLWGFA